ncbi:glycosyltransferase [Salinisphaera sp. C84B14]|uniref:glycosyltransferase n=1 Tax=Salinisphaera sp. C84B14 TaxID=1304155 RepID=UPI003340A3E9
MGKIRVLHCLETVGSGGVEQTRLSLAQNLDPTIYEQQLVCTKAVGSLPELFSYVGCEIHQVGEFRGIFDRRPYKATLGIVRKFRPHIIHGAVFEGLAQAAVTGVLGRVPVIIGEETSDPQNRRWTGRLLNRAFAGLCHHMVGVSPAVVDYLEKKIFVPKNKVTLINNGVAQRPGVSLTDLGVIREQLMLPADAFVIGTVGRLFDSHKRTSDLIKAMPLIVHEAPGAKLLIVGSGPDEETLHNLASKLGVEQSVIFAGYQGDPQAFYQLMDVFALASVREAFGLVLVEAMFAELPVVATHVGGIPDVVKDGDTGYLVEPSRPDDLASAILNLAHDTKKRRSMGQNGRKRAMARFGAKRYVDEVDRLYRRLLFERKVI